MLARLTASVNTVAWLLTKDGRKGRNRPKSIYEQLARDNNKEPEVTGFRSGKEFEAARYEILRRGGLIQ